MVLLIVHMNKHFDIHMFSVHPLVCVCVWGGGGGGGMCMHVCVWMKRPEGRVLTLEHERSTHGCA